MKNIFSILIVSLLIISCGDAELYDPDKKPELINKMEIPIFKEFSDSESTETKCQNDLKNTSDEIDALHDLFKEKATCKLSNIKQHVSSQTYKSNDDFEFNDYYYTANMDCEFKNKPNENLLKSLYTKLDKIFDITYNYFTLDDSNKFHINGSISSDYCSQFDPFRTSIFVSRK